MELGGTIAEAIEVEQHFDAPRLAMLETLFGQFDEFVESKRPSCCRRFHKSGLISRVACLVDT